jgi:hypothetical protein
MKTYKIAFEHTGEVSYTAKTPSRVYVEGTIDLTEQKSCILSHDDWRLCSVNRWEVHDVSLPDWLSPEEWISRSVEYKYVWGLGASPDWPESWHRGLLVLNTTERYAAIKLLATKTFRSAFRKSLRDQIVAWLETPPESRKYASPLSEKQWDAALGPKGVFEAKRLCEALYRL